MKSGNAVTAGNFRLRVLVLASLFVLTILTVTALTQKGPALVMPTATAELSAPAKRHATSASAFDYRTPPNTLVVGTCESLPGGVIEVEGTGGSGAQPTGYATLGAAFAAINTGVHTGTIVIDVCGNTAEGTATATLNASGSGAASYTSITISPAGGAARTISGATTAGSPMIDFNGADNVTVNGLNTGGNALTISNTTASATSGTSTIRYQTDATNNLLTNTSVLGSATMAVGTNGGNIWFGSAAVATGNDNNTVSNCNIGPAGANLPTKGIYFTGTSNTDPGTANSGIVITNNNIFDYFSASVSSAGIDLNSGTVGTTISNNRFFQTATRTMTVTGLTHSGIRLSNASGNAFQITGNTVGFATSAGTGVYDLVFPATTTGAFIPINVSVNTITVTNITNNTVAGIAVSGGASGTSSSAPFRGIYVSQGLATANNNTIGSQSATGSITYTSNSASASDVIGIFNFGSSNWTTNNNTIGGITVANSSTGAANLYGLRTNTSSGVTWTCTNNTIGGTVANSLQSSSTATGTTVQGIRNDNPIGTFTGNTIRNLTAAGGTGTTTAASVVGIVINAAANQTLSQNTIFNLSNTNTTAATIVTGIQFTGSTANVVERNLIYGLTSATNSATAEVNGIRVGGGTTTYRNNMIALGAGIANALGAAATNSGTTGINGINEFLGTDSFFHNSVYIGGSPTAGTGASYAFNGTQTINTRSFRDNIFFNARSNSGATGKNYAVKINGTTPNPTGLTINNNLYFANGTGAVFGFFNSLDVANLAAWKVAVGQDAGSFESNPQYNDPTNATPDLHLHPTLATVAEGNGAAVGVTDDFDGQTRASFTPVDIGADAGNFVGLDLTPPVISYTALLNTSLTTNRTVSVTLTDVTGVATGGVAPRIYYRKNAGAYFSQACALASGTPLNGMWNCTINHTDVGGVTTTDVITYFVIAQDTLGNLASNPAGAVATNVNTVTTPPAAPNTYTIVAAFAGPISVGTGQTYTSLTNPGGIFEALNAGAFTANVTINLTSDLLAETGTHALNQWAEDGVGGYTLLLKPSGAARTITGTINGALIKLNGADRVTIDGSTTGATATGIGGNAALRELTIQNTNTGTSAVVLNVGSGTNGAQNNAIKNVNILGQDPTTTLAGLALGSSSAPGTAGTDNDNNRVENCSVKRSIYGIFSSGQNAANPNTGTVITRNDLSATGTDRLRRIGIVVFNDNGVQITENSIGGLDTNESADGVGIGVGTQAVDNALTAAGGVTNALVSRNKINGVNSQSTVGFSAAGITVAGSPGGPNTVVNNMITGITAPATSPDLVAGIFVAGVTGSVTRVYHNSIALTGNRGTVAAQMPSFGVAISGADPTVELKNNIFYTTQTSGGGANAKSYAIGVNTTTFVNLDSNYNDFFASGANAGFFRSGSLAGGAGTDYATVAAWGAAVSDDANSQEVDPVYVNPLNDLHLNSMTTPLFGDGLTGFATVDFDNETRKNPPDIGADELPPPVTVVSIVRANASPTNAMSVQFTVTFSGSVTGVAPGNFAPAPTGAVMSAMVTGAMGSGTTWTVTVNTGTGSGTLGLDMVNATGMSPSVSNLPFTTGEVYTIDKTPPNAPVVMTPANGSITNNPTVPITGTAEPNSTVTVFIDGSPVGTTTADGGGNWMFTPPANLSDGTHTVRARATDAVGNVSTDSNTNTFTVDATPPDTTITGNPANPTNSTSASFSFTGNDGSGTGVASFQCKLDLGPFVACTSSQTYTGLADGSHTFQVRAIDNANNTDGTPATYTWTVDTAPPDTTITPPTPANPTNSTTANFSFTGNDGAGTGVASFACSLDGASFTPCTSTQTYTGLAAGSHNFQVRSIDIAGNTDPTPAEFTWMIDLTPPTVTINQASGQSDPTSASPINFTAVFSEAVTGLMGNDVNISGTAGGMKTATVTEIAPNNGTTYNVAVTGMTTGGTVIAAVVLNAAQDAAGNNSAASTSTDNTVTYQVPCPTTLTVNSLGDTADALAGNGVCADAGGNCSLRAAIQEANAITACSPLTINITAPGIINLTTVLPALNHPNLTINGLGASQSTVRRNVVTAFRIFTINSGKTVNLAGLTISNGDAGAGFGGGIISAGNLSINNCAIVGNRADNAGGLHQGGGMLNLSNSTISGNTTVFQGSGVNLQDTTATLTNCTISGNVSQNSQGGIANLVIGAATSTLNLVNCTITNNTSVAPFGAVWSAIETANPNATVTTTLKNTLVANNAGRNFITTIGVNDTPIATPNAQLTSLGNNLDSDGTSGFTNGVNGNLVGTLANPLNALLAPLGNYGGPTQTHALLPGSLAINAVTSAGAPATDQRGINRDANVDIGAFESRGFTLTIAGGNNQTAPLNTAFANSLLVGVTSAFSEPVNGGVVTFTPPGSGASAALTGNPATIAGGQASVSATANGTPGGYQVSAAANGGNTVNFNLTNACAMLTVTPPGLATGTAGVMYSQGFTQTGAFGNSAAWAISAGALPNGLTLNASSGLLSGTPTQTGTFNFTVKATDSLGCMGTRAYSLVIACPTVAINPATLPSGVWGTAYSQTLTGSGGIAPYTFALQAGSSLPTGLTLNGATGLISGTPTATGATTFTVLVTDANGCGGNRTYTVGIQCPTININPAPALPNPQAGVAYSQTLTGSGGVGPYTFALIGGTLPTGLTLAGGVISGTPTALGAFTFSVSVTDTGLSVGATPCGGNRTYTVTVGCPAINLSPATLPSGVQGTLYSQTLTAAPAGGSYSFALDSGVLPPGLTLAANGTLTGTPSAAGNYTFVVKATGWGTCAGTQSYNLLITATCGTITVNPASLPGGTIGTPYSQTVSASPAGTYSFSVVSGALPTGLTLDANTGVISGTPTAGGAFTPTIRATGTGGCTGQRLYVISVACATVTINPPTLAAATAGVPYSQQLTGSVAGTFTLLLGSLPPGINLSPAGLLSGTTTQTGSYNITVRLAAGNCSGTRAYTLVVSAGAPAALAQTADYDGDGKADMALWGGGQWKIARSSDQQTETPAWGATGDTSLLGDYDGDGQTDLAVFRPANGTWYVKRSSDGSVLARAWGAADDVTVPGDYDGDGKTDLAVWRPSEGNWYVLRSSNQQYAVTPWGLGSAPYDDVPVPGDYDGDGQTDLAVFRRSTGTWLVKLSSRRSSDGQFLVKAWGLGSDVPVAADYDGDGKTDFAVWRGGLWYVWQSASNSARVTAWGANYAPYLDQAAPGDYDGDGKADVAVWRAAEQTWYLRCSSDNSVLTQPQGQANDQPVGMKGR